MKTVKVFIILAGNTLDAHRQFMEILDRTTSVEEVSSAEECDVTFTFCPIVSRVGTDIEAAVKLIPSTPSGILIALHPTFDRDYVVPDASRFVPSPFLTVDCLFHEGELLDCDCNDNAFRSVSIFLRGLQKEILSTPTHRPSCLDSDNNQNLCQRFVNFLLQFEHPKFLLVGCVVAVVILFVITFVILRASHAI
ncbi:hypothetical protein ACEWY4_022148 [Coilia grayii]|uniref:Uncharacterized protein n=1 Tax=Coilia grayii TaxID=363190 RepID=A0ABD1J705_9TELE